MNGVKSDKLYEVVDKVPEGYYYVYSPAWQNDEYVPLFRMRGSRVIMKGAKAIRIPDKGFAIGLKYRYERHGAVSRQWFEILLSQHNYNHGLL